MASYRGEVTAGHPDFPEGSAAACREAFGPVDLNVPDIVYTTKDDEVIDRFHRDIGCRYVHFATERWHEHILHQQTRGRLYNSVQDCTVLYKHYNYTRKSPLYNTVTYPYNLYILLQCRQTAHMIQTIQR
ncbi:uncharacterized protein F5147DRAFT_619562, partial [Suillus discolor]